MRKEKKIIKWIFNIKRIKKKNKGKVRIKWKKKKKEK